MNAETNIFIDNIFEWGILTLSIIGLGYAAYVIKNERSNFLETAIPLDFKRFLFKIPSWWSNTYNDENHLVFERTDTRYDWKAHFRWFNFNDGDISKDLQEAFAEIIKDKNIVFDTDTSVIKNPTDFSSHPAFRDTEPDMIRVEGTATQDLEDRIYYDAFLIRDKKQNGFLFCESRSSILNGMLEGPYFEEVLLQVEKVKN